MADVVTFESFVTGNILRRGHRVHALAFEHAKENVRIIMIMDYGNARFEHVLMDSEWKEFEEFLLNYFLTQSFRLLREYLLATKGFIGTCYTKT